MQRASDELFSGSVAGLDDGAGRCCRSFFNLLHQRAHHGALADDLEGRVDGLAQPSVLLLEIEIRERIAQHHENPICIERFLQNLVRAGLSCLNRGANCGVATNHHNEGRRIELADSLRSEEHTSELQSLAYLVCRLLLEKKKKYLLSDHCAYV